MKNRFLIAAMSLCLVGAAQGQAGPNVKEMKPGKYDYQIEVNNPALPFKLPAMTFSQCVSAKDLDEGRAFQSQRDAGMDCKYSNVQSSPGRFTFTAVCKMKGDMGMEADYEGTVSGNTVIMNVRQKMTGGGIPDNMRNSTTKMTMTRQGDC